MRVKSPCKDCPDRTIEPVNCHSYCEKFIEYKNINRERKNQEYEEINVDRQLRAIHGQWRSYSQSDPRPESLKHGRQVRKDKN